jgi:hypothetical protein
MKTGKFLRRNRKGALAAEYVATLYLLLMFIVFPMINYATVGLRAFFLWFACNEAVITAVKCRTFFQSVTIGGVLYPGAYVTAQSRAQQIQGVFPGIYWNNLPTNPEVDIIVTQIPGQPASVPAPPLKTVGPTPLGVGHTPDSGSYVCSLRVSITGWVMPLIEIPWFKNIQGLGGQMNLLVTSEGEFENPPGLQI